MLMVEVMDDGEGFNGKEEYTTGGRDECQESQADTSLYLAGGANIVPFRYRMPSNNEYS